MTTAKNESSSLSSGLLEELAKGILSGAIKPGTKLTEQMLCDKYNVSRTPVRETLKQLEADSLVESIPNRGVFVIGLTPRDISDLFDMRLLYETQAVKWAIERLTDEEIDKLQECIEFMEFYTLKNDAEKVLQFNHDFHDIIYNGTRNLILAHTLRKYRLILSYSAPANIFSSEYLENMLKEHKAIYTAIRDRNVAAGATAAEEHLRRTKIRRLSRFF